MTRGRKKQIKYKPPWTVAKVICLEDSKVKTRLQIKVKISEPLKEGFSYFIQSRSENLLKRRLNIIGGYVSNREFDLAIENIDEYLQPYELTKGTIIADCIVINTNQP
ncbi:MAG: hypothetical protein HRU26_03510 [Psychroserpens sp.]|nr:hypothetical protein [Psychroserpens sp.]